MLSKEEIETCKEELNNYIEFMETAVDNAGWARGLKWYIEQLETKANKYDSLVKKIKDKVKEINEKIKENNKIIKVEWLDTHMSMDDYFKRKNNLTRENEILEITRKYLQKLLKEAEDE